MTRRMTFLFFVALAVAAHADYMIRATTMEHEDRRETAMRRDATNIAASVVSDSAISRTNATLTAPGVETDYLAQRRGSVVRGGVRIRYSSTDEDNLTAYLYDGVAVRRGGATDDFLWGTTNAQGVVRFKDLAPIITSICLDLMGNIYWQTDDGGVTMDAYYRDAQTISNIVSEAVSFVANGAGNAYIVVEDGTPGLYMADEEDAGGIDDRNPEE